jgi:uncharacterized linocin/CFP29 family protein
MNHLMRHLAPITPETWETLDGEARARLQPVLGARTLVDFAGPLGWEYSAINIGRVTEPVDGPVAGTTVRRRVVLPLAEVRAAFSLAREELDVTARGATDTDLTALDEAAVRLAELENGAIVNGSEALGIRGIVPSSPHPPIGRGDGPAQLPRHVASAIEVLSRAGVGGPYGLAVDSAIWVDALGGNDAGGQPLRTHVESALGGPIVWTPGIEGAVVVSLRGGDFSLGVGEDISLGYLSHTADEVELYLEESFSFGVATPEAAIAIR